MPKKPIAYRGSEPFVFVSYAHADAELAYPIISGLQERGLRVWFDEGIEAGELWDEVIPDYVEQCAAMLCLVSTRFTDSQNCKNEIRYANELKKEVLILHLEDGELPRYIRFHYSSIHALRLRDYSDRGRLLDKLSATEKLRICLGQMQGGVQEPEGNPEELYQKGLDCFVAESYEEAVKWYRKAAEQGHAGAMRKFGLCLQHGWGISESGEEAIRWYLRAAEKGDANAMVDLGDCYQSGWSVTESGEEAMLWYRRAADKGNTDAMCKCAALYKMGFGVSQSYEESAKWYRRAAEAGDTYAMCELVSIYAKGRGVAQSFEEAEMWDRRAADKGVTAEVRKFLYGFG